MPIVPIVPADIVLTAVTLPRYAQIIEVGECFFFGVNGSSNGAQCNTIWTLDQRRAVASQLAAAQNAIETQLGYPIGPRWISEKQRPFIWKGLADWGYIIEGGVKATSLISAGEAVNHATDPAIIGPFATTVTNVNEIAVYHAGTTIEIIPSAITISGGNCTIEIPRCRMVIPSKMNNPASGWSYSNTTVTGVFAQTVDIWRVYNDQTTQGIVVTNHDCSNLCAGNGCAEETGDACEYIINPVIGTVEVNPANYVGGQWVARSCSRGWLYMRLNYKAGRDVWQEAEDAIVRLAHSMLPNEPCGCDAARMYWTRDRFVPTVLSAERLNCPFGISDGAWYAWQFVLRERIMRGRTIY